MSKRHCRLTLPKPNLQTSPPNLPNPIKSVTQAEASGGHSALLLSLQFHSTFRPCHCPVIAHGLLPPASPSSSFVPGHQYPAWVMALASSLGSFGPVTSPKSAPYTSQWTFNPQWIPSPPSLGGDTNLCMAIWAGLGPPHSQDHVIHSSVCPLPCSLPSSSFLLRTCVLHLEGPWLASPPLHAPRVLQGHCFLKSVPIPALLAPELLLQTISHTVTAASW